MNRTIHIAILILGLAGMTARAEDVIVVLKSRELAPYNEAVVGFTAQWNVTGSGSVIQTHTLTDSVENLAGSLTGGNSQLRAVVAVGTEAAKWAIKHTNVPVVFCMVANAEQNLFAELDVSEAARLTGVSLDIPVETQLKQLATFLPNVKRLGVLYDPQKSEAAVKEAAVAAAQLGLQFVPQPVVDERAVSDAVQALASRVDAVWAPVDSTVYNSRSAQFVLTRMLQKKIPVLGFSENMVKAGALLGPRVDYASVGKQTAELLQIVLRSESTRGANVQSPRDFQMVVNARVLKLVNKPIPPAALQQASFVNED